MASYKAIVIFIVTILVALSSCKPLNNNDVNGGVIYTLENIIDDNQGHENESVRRIRAYGGFGRYPGYGGFGGYPGHGGFGGYPGYGGGFPGYGGFGSSYSNAYANAGSSSGSYYG